MPPVIDSLALAGDVAAVRPRSAERSDREALTAAVHAEVLDLFDACAPSLRRYVRACGVDAPAVDDVVQEAFLALFHHLRRGGARHNLRGWLVQVSFRLALKQRQRASRRQRIEQSADALLAEMPDGEEDAEQAMLGKHRDERLRAIYRALPERDRQCLMLRADGVRYRDIARVLGVSLGTVASTLTRAMARLSTVVTEHQR